MSCLWPALPLLLPFQCLPSYSVLYPLLSTSLFVSQDVDDVEEEDDHGEVSRAPADGAGQHQHRHEASVSVGVGCAGRTDDSMDQAGQR